jgi:Uma2 family endonuclease
MRNILADDQPRRITAAEFSAMLSACIFEDERERVELLDGVIYSLAPPESEGHRRTINRLNRLLTSRFPEPYIIQPQSTLYLGTFDVPQPDFVVYRSNDAFTPYVERDEVVLLIEVSESSLRRDRVVKAPLFARYALSEYWIVNVAKREVELYSAPEDGQYGSKRTFAPHESIVSEVFPGEPLTPSEFVLG